MNIPQDQVGPNIQSRAGLFKCIIMEISLKASVMCHMQPVTCHTQHKIK